MYVYRAAFILVAIAMSGLLVSAFFQEDATGPLDLLRSPWGRLTVLDAYFAITIAYFLTAFRERSGWLRLLWLMLYLALGSLAIASYMLLRFPARSEAAAVD